MMVWPFQVFESTARADKMTLILGSFFVSLFIITKLLCYNDYMTIKEK